MNKVILVGRLTKDPEMRTTASGVNSTTFTLAVNRNFTNQNGEREADFLNCVAWRKLAETISKFCTKGSQVAVEGRIQTRSYDAQDGSKRYVTEIMVDNIDFLGSRKDSVGQANYAPASDNNFMETPNLDTTDLTTDPYEALGEEVALSDDDLPF